MRVEYANRPSNVKALQNIDIGDVFTSEDEHDDVVYMRVGIGKMIQQTEAGRLPAIEVDSGMIAYLPKEARYVVLNAKLVIERD